MTARSSSLTPTQSLKAIRAIIADGIGGERFWQTLRRNNIPHLSFSQVAAVNYCHQKYYLNYVKRVKLKPVPNYFIKGNLMHQFIASSYKRIANEQKINPSTYLIAIHRVYRNEHRIHLENAVQVHLSNIWQDHEILGVEQPFVFMVDRKLPPLVGVIDLLLKKDNHVIIVDHKTGSDFYKPDKLQMAIYHQFARKKFPRKEIDIYYDQYRWVNNLQRIRKPPIQRTKIHLPDSSWETALGKIHTGYKAMKDIRENDYGKRNGECFRCPFREHCL
jgi:hypothetical protein